MIRVAAAVVHAPSPHPRRDPIVFLDGGPSFGAISTFALGAYFAGAPYIENRDLILVDTRGTGLSRPRLGCREFDRADVSSFYSKPFVGSSYVEDFSAATAACHDRLSKRGIDLSAYNSAEGAADLDDLRRALGYARWNLVAISADGVLGLTYMRLYPRDVRSAILDSPEGPQNLRNLDYLRGMSRELGRIFAGCAANTACDAAYPDLRTVFYDTVHQLRAHPAKITIQRFRPHPITLRITGVDFYLDALFGGIFAGNAFEPEHIHDLISELWRAGHGELRAVYRQRLGIGPVTNSHFNDFFAQGKTMSYACHDLVGFITHRDLAQAAEDIPALAPFFLDPDYGLPEGPAGCRIWDVGVADPVQHEPVSSAIPTLVLAGEYDTGEPPFVVRQIPPTLSNSFFYEFPAGGHLQLADYNFASPCARSIADQFIDAPAVRPDASCLASVAPFDFTPPGATATQRRNRAAPSFGPELPFAETLGRFP
jgi:pimeloyl-ACP methyl ester carboxylesterase